MKSIYIELRGKTPLLMHRYIGEQPSQAKPPRGKKTEEWIKTQQRRDWMNSAYYNPVDQRFELPSEVIEGAMAEAAKKIRKGTDFKQSVTVEEFSVPLWIYSGPDDPKGRLAAGTLESYYERAEHRDLRGVGIQKARVDRCRPRFNYWGVKFMVIYDPDVVELSDLRSTLERVIIGDYRPKYGQAQLVTFGELGLAA